MEEKRGKGRPRLDTEPVNLRLPRGTIEAIDNMRREEADLPSRPEMIRRLLEQVIGKRDD